MTAHRSLPPDIPDFDCERCIGSGAYGDVWIARSLSGAYRAVKVVHRNRFENAAPYEREFKAIQKYERVSCRHPALIDILHVGRCDDAAFYYVMYLADSLIGRSKATCDSYQPKTLSSLISERGAVPVEGAVKEVDYLLGGLSALHAAGLIHRDIKPSNILYLDKHPVLADVGLVTQAGDDVSRVGTDGYVPPEGPGKPGADLYAMGMVLYVTITGKQPADFPEPPTLADERNRLLFSHVNHVILKACADQPTKRYVSAATMRRALKAAGSRPARAGERVRPAPHRNATQAPAGDTCPHKADFKQELVHLIRDTANRYLQGGPGGRKHLTKCELQDINAQIGMHVEIHFGCVPHEVRVACKLAEVAIEPSVVQRMRLLKDAVRLGGGLGGVGLVIAGVGMAVGWGEGMIAAVTTVFVDSSLGGPIGLIVGGLVLLCMAIFFGARRYDPVSATTRALKTLEHGVLAALDSVWARHGCQPCKEVKAASGLPSPGVA